MESSNESAWAQGYKTKLVALVQNSHLNGEMGTLKAFNRATGNWTVQLDNRNRVEVETKNLGRPGEGFESNTSASM